MPPTGASSADGVVSLHEGPATSVGGTDEVDMVADRGGSVDPVVGMKEKAAKSVPRREPPQRELQSIRPPRPDVSVSRAVRQRVAKCGGRRSARARGRGGADMAGGSAVSERVMSAPGETPRARIWRMDAGVVDKGLQPWRGLDFAVEGQRIEGCASGAVRLARMGLKPREEGCAEPTVSRGGRDPLADSPGSGGWGAEERNGPGGVSRPRSFPLESIAEDVVRRKAAWGRWATEEANKQAGPPPEGKGVRTVPIEVAKDGGSRGTIRPT